MEREKVWWTVRTDCGTRRTLAVSRAKAERNVRYCAFQDTANIQTEHLQRTVSLGSMHHGMLRDSFLCDASSSLNQCLHAIDFSSYLIHARTEYSTANLYHVLITVQR